MADDHIKVVYEEIEANRKLWEAGRVTMAKVIAKASDMEFRNRPTELFRPAMAAHDAVITRFLEVTRKGDLVWLKIEMTLRAAGMLNREAEAVNVEEVRRLAEEIRKL